LINKTIGIIIRYMDGRELRMWRKAHGLTQTELGKLLGVWYVAVGRWERGERKIPSFLPLALEALEHRMQEGGKVSLNALFLKP
jgi:transcriptional regulator with XRE-family HTH domain